MVGHFFPVFKNVVIEELAPDGSIFRWQVTDRENRVIQSILRLAKVTRRVAPPVVEQDVEWRQAFDVMPP